MQAETDRRVGEANLKSDRLLAMWNAVDGAPRPLPGTPGEALTSLAFDPDGRVLAYGGSDGTITLWDVTHAKTLRSLKTQSRRVAFVAFSPNGSLLCSHIANWRVALWDTRTGHLACVTPVTVVSEAVHDNLRIVAWTSDSRRIVIGGAHHVLHICDAANGSEILRLYQTAGAPIAEPVAVSPTGERIVWGACIYETEGCPELNWRRKILADAAAHIGKLRDEYSSIEEIVAQLEADSSLSEPVRGLAIRLAELFPVVSER